MLFLWRSHQRHFRWSIFTESIYMVFWVHFRWFSQNLQNPQTVFFNRYAFECNTLYTRRSTRRHQIAQGYRRKAGPAPYGAWFARKVQLYPKKTNLLLKTPQNTPYQPTNGRISAGSDPFRHPKIARERVSTYANKKARNLSSSRTIALDRFFSTKKIFFQERKPHFWAFRELIFRRNFILL